jgi:xanthine dehydrogenase accessory factor
MRDILAAVEKWISAGTPTALATVVETWGSSPRGVGAKMAMTAGGEIAGSVSGGCVEGAVVEVGVEVLNTGRPQLLHFGVADETAWDVGLACGGSLNVFVQMLDVDFFQAVHPYLENNRPLAIATILRGSKDLVGRSYAISEGVEIFENIGEEFRETAREAVLAGINSGKSQRTTLGEEDALEIFVEVVPHATTLVIVGGVHIAIPLTTIAKALGYRTVVIDPRRAFGNLARFPEADQLIQAWPDEAFAQITLTPATAVAMLTHDPKIDDPALKIALRSPAFYIGALGSRTTHARRRERLLAGGLSEREIERLHAPIGMDLGGRVPEEIALAIMAEVVAVRHGGKD